MKHVMTSSNGIIFRVSGPLWGESIGHRPSQRPVTRSFDVFFGLCFWFWLIILFTRVEGSQKNNAYLAGTVKNAWTNGGVNNRDAGGLRLHRAHYDVTVMKSGIIETLSLILRDQALIVLPAIIENEIRNSIHCYMYYPDIFWRNPLKLALWG